jgi:hypothetical protein
MRAHQAYLKGIYPLALFIACACSSPYSNPSTGDTGNPSGSGSEVESLFVPSIDGSGAANFDFETSDTAYLGDKGYTLWALKAAPQEPFTSRTVSLDKLSGNAAAGFGIVFCRHPALSPSEETMLVAMINTQQEYIVGEAVGSIFTEIVPWTHSTYLKQGYNQTNILSISLDAETHKFTLSLNGNPMPDFSALDPGYPLNGDNGYIAVVSPFEEFPATSVHITYKE